MKYSYVLIGGGLDLLYHVFVTFFPSCISTKYSYFE